MKNQIMNTQYITMNLLSEYLLLYQWFPYAVHENEITIWFRLSFTN